MLYRKKIDISYKRYKSNFEKKIRFEEVEEEYNEIKDEIFGIINSNNLNEDHILLIDLDTIYQYYISKWKKNVLIENKKETIELKKMQVAVFYTCIVQDLYKTRYPNMRLQYNFRDIVLALVHFNLFGWTKEEDILFKFITENIGSNILDMNDYNTHVWFLLELYLRYTNKTILGTNKNVNLMIKKELSAKDLNTNFIPDTLNVYENTLNSWETKDLKEITELMKQMIEYHTIKAENIGDLDEFTNYIYGFYPIEILYLIQIRKKLGLSVPEKFDDFLMNTPEAKMEFKEKELYPEMDELVEEIDKFYRRNYPEYIPNKHGELFK